ncbi:FHA domain-containing protein [Dactylosporangium fulvum]|uniref:FHA domain-containing protein n=1 Tax=Dactylosporangium fulvum TaxID=53359 RepID=A0ABY5W4N6_9ACTN|nr:FHA domain-containing protein [Dactylosporangium fulvum]UWP85028.1 FHA domain-containing protein [Dactylosporangium fulvum]
MTGYVPGEWLAFAGKNVWALANVQPGDPETDECWKLVQSGATAAEIASVLSGGSFGTASFVVVRADAYGARALVRGDAHAEVLDVDGYTVSVRAADGAGRDVFRPAATVRLEGPRPLGTVPAELPLERGVVLASSLMVRLTEPVEYADEPEPDEQPEPAERPAAADRPVPVQRTAAEQPAFIEKPPPPALAEPTSWVARAAGSGPTAARATVPGSSADRPAAPGSTVARAAVPGASAAWAPTSESPAGRSAPTGSATDLAAPAEFSTGRVAPAVSSAGRVAVPEGRRGATITAVRCPVGHANPPGSVLCRVCRIPVPSQAPVQVDLPLPGVLRLPGGETVPLDRRVILGRAPGVPDPGVPDPAHHVTVTSPDNGISRRHVEIRADGWEVIAVDLGSRNGTIVQQPGERPVELPARGSQTLRPGAAVVLTDQVSIRYELTG